MGGRGLTFYFGRLPTPVPSYHLVYFSFRPLKHSDISFENYPSDYAILKMNSEFLRPSLLSSIVLRPDAFLFSSFLTLFQHSQKLEEILLVSSPLSPSSPTSVKAPALTSPSVPSSPLSSGPQPTPPTIDSRQRCKTSSPPSRLPTSATPSTLLQAGSSRSLEAILRTTASIYPLPTLSFEPTL